MEERPPLKPFWMVPFTLQATKGLLRDQRSRRVIMAISVGVTLLLLLCGLTVLRAWLDPHEHPWRFILYWLLCGWQTLLALLLALLDILMVQAQARAARKALRDDAKQKAASGE
jgi:protein-S-isoprenylcysteine O-methyltransferase Ste14